MRRCRIHSNNIVSLLMVSFVAYILEIVSEQAPFGQTSLLKELLACGKNG